MTDEAMTKSIRVAVDAGSGDHAPEAMVRGALAALIQDPRLSVCLVGDLKALADTLARIPESAGVKDRWFIESAEEFVAEGGGAAWAVRDSGARSSVAVVAKLVQEGSADAGISVGNTGAALTAARLELGLMAGLRRAVAGLTFPFAPRSFVLDVGPNVEVNARHLLGFARLGVAYVRDLWGTVDPRVGLLSNGVEASKGTRQVREAYRLLEASGLHFIGAIEGGDLVAGRAEVVVTDGYVGNVVLKVVEALAGWYRDRLVEAWAERPEIAKWAGIERLLSDTSRLSDATQYPSPPLLLGVNGIFLLGHGRSGADEMATLIERAAWVVRKNTLGRLREALTD
jgi:glycerol-3-phosphate acyltransferase PlsX